MTIISSDVQTNLYKLFCVNTQNFSYSFKKLGVLHHLGFSKDLREIDLNFIDTYHELEVYTIVKNYTNSLKPLTEFKELELPREQGINDIIKETKIKFTALNDEINDALKRLEFELEHETLKNRYLNNLNHCEDRIKLRLSSKEEIIEIERLKEEVEIDEDKLLNAETFKLLTDLKHERKDILHNVTTSESKLIELGIPLI